MAGGPRALAWILALLVIAGCTGRGRQPPRPTRSLEPTTVGIVARVDNERAPSVVVLASGLEIPVSNLGGSAALSRRGNIDPGVLWLSDSPLEPTWHAWALPNGTIWPGQRQLDPGCFELTGGAYDEGAFVHFSSGLRLAKTPDFRIFQTDVEDPWPAREGDVFCVTRDGTVQSLAFIFLPY
jgi:hypothetical protein